MSTSRITFRRRVRRSALALAVSAICLPSTALAQGDTKYDLQSPTPAPARTGDTPADFPGMPGGPDVEPEAVSSSPEAGGFDWTSAAIGAGAAGLVIVVSLGGAGAASRIRMRTVRS